MRMTFNGREDINRAWGKKQDDLLFAAGQTYDLLVGNGGDDTLISQSAKWATLRGGKGNDKLTLDTGTYGLGLGGKGDDVLTVKGGSARLTGGEGADTFNFETFRSEKSKIVVTDFDAEEDMLQIVTSIEAEDIVFREKKNGDLVIRVDNKKIVLKDTDLEDIEGALTIATVGDDIA